MENNDNNTNQKTIIQIEAENCWHCPNLYIYNVLFLEKVLKKQLKKQLKMIIFILNVRI